MIKSVEGALLINPAYFRVSTHPETSESEDVNSQRISFAIADGVFLGSPDAKLSA